MTLGQRIQELRKQAGLSQEALGETLGVSRQAVSKWEADGGIPELDSLIAMSRRFGISIGVLLGVEEPAPETEEERENPAASVDETRVEAILRRYVEETRPAGPTRLERVKKWGWVPVLVLVLAVVLGVLFARIGSLQNTVRTLQGNIISVNNNVSNLSGSIRNTILDVLEEENNPISDFEYEVIGFGYDPEGHSVTLRLDAALKTYTRGVTAVQYLVNWETGEERGEQVSDWIYGPDWTGQVTLPLNERTTVTVRIREEGELYREFAIHEPIYHISEANFELEAYNLMRPFDLTIRGRNFVSETARGEWCYIEILSVYPEYLQPTDARLTAWYNGEEFLDEGLTLTENEEPGLFEAALAGDYVELTMKEGDTLEVRLTVTDSWGRTREFRTAGKVSGGELLKTPVSAPLADE